MNKLHPEKIHVCELNKCEKKVLEIFSSGPENNLAYFID